jgi:hypothetical protein
MPELQEWEDHPTTMVVKDLEVDICRVKMGQEEWLITTMVLYPDKDHEQEEELQTAYLL